MVSSDLQLPTAMRANLLTLQVTQRGMSAAQQRLATGLKVNAALDNPPVYFAAKALTNFLRSPYGIPMITNSSLQLLMKQSPTAIDNIQSTFNLTDEEKFLLLESGVGEGIFFAGMKHVAIKVIASYTEDQIITSDPSQILQIKKAREELRNSLT